MNIYAFRTQVLCLMILFSCYVLSAQLENSASFLEDKTLIELETLEGDRYQGYLILMRSEGLHLESVEGITTTFDIKQIKDVSPVEGIEMQYGAFGYENPSAHRNVLLETAYSLEQGQIQYQNTMVFVNTVSYGITDHFSVSGGIELFSLLLDDGSPAFFIQPKYTVTKSTSPVQFALGVNFISIPGNKSNDLVGSVYAVTTLGSKDRNVSLGGAYLIGSDNNIARPAFQVGGQYRWTESIGVVSDNLIFYFEEYRIAYSFLLRYLKPTWNFDIGVTFGEDFPFPAPVLNFGYRIGAN